MLYLNIKKQTTQDLNKESMLFVHDMMIKHFNFDDSCEEIIFNEFGKPYYKNKKLYFNISHSNNVILVGVSDTELGVDIECIKDYKRIIEKKMFNKEELLFLNSLDYDNRLDVFFERWTKIEAWTKYNGLSITHGLKNKDFSNTFSFKINYNNNEYYISYQGSISYCYEGE